MKRKFNFADMFFAAVAGSLALLLVVLVGCGTVAAIHATYLEIRDDR